MKNKEIKKKYTNLRFVLSGKLDEPDELDNLDESNELYELDESDESNEYYKSLKFMINVAKLIRLVSSSVNGDKIPPSIKDKEWQLIPRYADRLEAIGMIGIQRCYEYNFHKGVDPYNDKTPRPKDEIGIWKEATEKRYEEYKGGSKSMIDHFYDKLLRLSVFPIRNPYFDAECEKRRKPLIDFLLKFGNGEINNYADIEKFILQNKNKY